MTGSARITSEKEVTFAIKRLKDNVYEINLRGLKNVEYTIVLQDEFRYFPSASTKLYCFAVEE